MKIKAVIFDMDGVLIDSKEWHFEALNKALAHYGMEISRHDHFVTFDGLPTKKKLELLSLKNSLPREVHQKICDLKQQYTEEFIHSSCKPNPLHELTLSKLASDGIKMAVCSNSIRKTIDLMMEQSNLAKYLQFSLSSQDVSKTKPDPEIYLKAIEKLGLTAKECLILEDNENGIQAAIASGAHLLRINSVDEVSYENIVLNL